MNLQNSRKSRSKIPSIGRLVETSTDYLYNEWMLEKLRWSEPPLRLGYDVEFGCSLSGLRAVVKGFLFLRKLRAVYCTVHTEAEEKYLRI